MSLVFSDKDLEGLAERAEHVRTTRTKGYVLSTYGVNALTHDREVSLPDLIESIPALVAEVRRLSEELTKAEATIDGLEEVAAEEAEVQRRLVRRINQAEGEVCRLRGEFRRESVEVPVSS